MSEGTSNWSVIVDVATILTGLGATATAYFSWKLSQKALQIQERHNRLTLRPIPFLAFADYEETLRVKFRNEGAGPYIVKSLRVCRGNECKKDLIAWMDTPPEGIYWYGFTSIFEGRAVLPNNELILLELRGNIDSPNFARFRDSCRDKLSSLRVLLEYTDIYGSTFELYLRSLDWFARDKGTRKNKVL